MASAPEQGDRPFEGEEPTTGQRERSASGAPARIEEVAEGTLDPRMRSAWRSWLSALGTDSEAAMAAALTYESLAGDARDAWLDALDADAIDLDVPRVALYAPLLAVEADTDRRARIAATLAEGGVALEPAGDVRALHGMAPTGDHVCVVVSPLYLDFVAVLICRYDPDSGVRSARRDPVRNIVDVLGAHGTGGGSGASIEFACAHSRCVVDDVDVREVPLRDVIEGLAHAVIADRRAGRNAPAALSTYAHLFAPDLQSPPVCPSTPAPKTPAPRTPAPSTSGP